MYNKWFLSFKPKRKNKTFSKALIEKNPDHIGVGRVKKGSALTSVQRGIDGGSKQGLGFEMLTRNHSNNKFWKFM